MTYSGNFPEFFWNGILIMLPTNNLMDLDKKYSEDVVAALQLKYGNLVDLGKDQEETVWAVQNGNSGLCVVSMHHANEFYGTWEAIVEAHKAGTEFSSIPVVNVDYFDEIYRRLDRLRDITDIPVMFSHMVYQFMRSNSGVEHPSWNKWNYGQGGERPEFVEKIESLTRDSRVVLDFHNTPSTEYFIVTSPVESGEQGEIQDELEKLVVEVIKSDGFKIRRGNYLFGHLERREGVYQQPSESTRSKGSLNDYLQSLDIVNLAIEVPAFTFNSKGRHELNDLEKLIKTNKKIIQAVANYLI